MSTVAAIGSARRISGFALAGVDVCFAEDAEAAHAACDGLGHDVGLVFLTPEAATVLEARLSEREGLVWVTLPE
jgi:vacuolar-type H+-ATPase subunit F/Vma7